MRGITVDIMIIIGVGQHIQLIYIPFGIRGLKEKNNPKKISIGWVGPRPIPIKKMENTFIIFDLIR